MRAAYLAAMAISLASPALSAPVPAWAVDQAHSSLGFTGSMNGQAFKGRFLRWNADIAFNPADLAHSRVATAIDIKSATTGDATRDQSLPTPDWFSAALFPKASFQATQFRALGGQRYLALGTLQIRNISKQVSLPFDLTISGNRAAMHGSLAIDRTLFGVGQGQWTADEPVSKSVRIEIQINAVRKP